MNGNYRGLADIRQCGDDAWNRAVVVIDHLDDPRWNGIIELYDASPAVATVEGPVEIELIDLPARGQRAVAQLRRAASSVLLQGRSTFSGPGTPSTRVPDLPSA